MAKRSRVRKRMQRQEIHHDRNDMARLSCIHLRFVVRLKVFQAKRSRELPDRLTQQLLGFPPLLSSVEPTAPATSSSP
jgi:hypothetical protein